MDLSYQACSHQAGLLRNDNEKLAENKDWSLERIKIESDKNSLEISENKNEYLKLSFFIQKQKIGIFKLILKKFRLSNQF